jgi:hypothetical protein
MLRGLASARLEGFAARVGFAALVGLSVVAVLAGLVEQTVESRELRQGRREQRGLFQSA